MPAHDTKWPGHNKDSQNMGTGLKTWDGLNGHTWAAIDMRLLWPTHAPFAPPVTNAVLDAMLF